MDYREYLDRIVELTRRASNPATGSSYPEGIDSGPLRALYDNLKEPDGPIREHGPQVMTREARARELDRAIRRVKKADWRGNRFKEREVRNAIRSVLGSDDASIETIFQVAKAQSDY